MLGNGGNVGFSSFPWLMVPIDHHGASHHGSRPQMIEYIKKIDRWEVEQFAYLLEKMDAIDEGGRTMLDNSLVLLSSEIGDGNAHDQKNKAMLVAGTAGGAFKTTGTHLAFPGEPIADLYISVLHALGVPATTFGTHGKRPLAL